MKQQMDKGKASTQTDQVWQQSTCLTCADCSIYARFCLCSGFRDTLVSLVGCCV